MSLAAYVAEDGLVGHQWEEKPLILQRFYAPVQGNARARKWEWGGGLRSRVGGGYRALSQRKLGKGIAFEMLMKKISNKKKEKKKKERNPVLKKQQQHYHHHH